MTNCALTTGENTTRNQLLVEEFKLPVAPDSADVKKTESGFVFKYFEIETTKKTYSVPMSEYNRIVNSINDGTQLVRIGSDVVNIKQIKFMSEGTKHLNMMKYEMKDGVACQVLDEEKIKRFQQLIGM